MNDDRAQVPTRVWLRNAAMIREDYLHQRTTKDYAVLRLGREAGMDADFAARFLGERREQNHAGG